MLYNVGMKLSLDEYEKVKALISGLFQFGENELYSQAALAVTDTELFLYDDHRPTDKNGGVYHYQIKKRYKISDIDFILDERITKNPDLCNNGRLYFYSEDENKSFEFYYFLNDKKEVSDFLKILKEKGVITQKRKVALKSIDF